MMVPEAGQVRLAGNQEFDLEEDHVGRLSMFVPFNAGNLDGNRLATPVFRRDAFFLHLLLHAIDVGPLRINLINPTIIALLASLANLSASSVCGLKASSAAITRIETSVTLLHALHH